MSFKSCENTGGLMEEGDYEVICLKAVETCTQTSQIPCIAFDFQVRSDVEQKYQKKHIFKNFYQDESGNWPEQKIGKLGNALGIPKGAEFDIPDLEGRCCILHMKPFVGSDGTERDAILFSAPTKAGQAVQTLAAAPEPGYEEVDDDELPF